MWNPFFPWKLLNKVNTSAWVSDNSRQLHRASFRDQSRGLKGSRCRANTRLHQGASTCTRTLANTQTKIEEKDGRRQKRREHKFDWESKDEAKAHSPQLPAHRACLTSPSPSLRSWQKFSKAAVADPSFGQYTSSQSLTRQKAHGSEGSRVPFGLNSLP